MKILALGRYALGVCVSVALLPACSGGSQPPLSPSPQGLTTQLSLGRQAYDSVHTFGRSKGDGTYPEADLIDVKGTLYGTTVTGGVNGGYGTVFSITTSGEETVLHSFGGSGDGANPSARLLNVNGSLYGTTAQGGANYGGTVFSIAPDGTEKVLHSFDYNYSFPQTGGSIPKAGLINVKGTLYGTTATGGANDCGGDDFCGTVFSITTSGMFKVMYSFGTGSGDGSFPQAPLLNVDGTLYGTTMSGGKYGDGAIFAITTAGEEHTVYSFGANQSDGQNPMSGLIDVQGRLYGTTKMGGQNKLGTVFAVTTDGVEAMSFCFNGTNGSQPVAGLKNVKGVLYGTTTTGGANNLGTVFRITKSGKETVLHSFANGSAQQPRAGLAAIAGTLYGTTFGVTGSGSKKKGNVFSLTP